MVKLNTKHSLPAEPTPEGDHFDVCGYSCCLLYQEQGLGTALSYLFAYLRAYYPLTRIFCGFRHYQSTLFVPIADTLRNASNVPITLASSSLSEEEVNVLMGPDSFEPYIIQADGISPETVRQRYGGFRYARSYLRVPLFEEGEAKLQMAFLSESPNVFTPADGKLLFRLTRPLGEAVRKDFQQSPGRVPSTIKPKQSEKNIFLNLFKGLSRLRAEVATVARTDCTVLITGETGVGKEIVVDALQAQSSRQNAPFIKINCGALSENLLESELFGHDRNAFTGAGNQRTGYFEAANGGTLFLDEIGDLSPRMQVLLLRVLDRKEIQRVGSTTTVPLNVRIMAATHRNLRRMVTAGTFREDLWYRLNVYTVNVPPLREHKEDIPTLTHFFALNIAQSMGIITPPVISQEEWNTLLRHHWPGNVRELRHVIEKALIRAKVSASALLLHFELPEAPEFFPAAPNSHPAETCPPVFELPPAHALPTLAQWSDHYIAHVLSLTKGKITGSHGAAAILGVHPNTLREKRKRLLPHNFQAS